jgi:hypothetical protein
MPVILIGGNAGVGKTSGLFTIANIFRPTMWAAFEAKDKKFFDKVLKNEEGQPPFEYKIVGRTYPPDHTDMFGNPDGYMPDPVTSLGEFELWVRGVIRSGAKTIVVDTIANLRGYAKEEWIIRDNNVRIKNGLKPRETIGKDNLSAWSDINDRVKKLLMPLIQYGYATNANVFLTAQMTEVRDGDGHVIDEGIDIKRWIHHDVETVFVMRRDGQKYIIECEKIPRWANSESGAFTTELRRDDGLLELLSLYGLIQP